MRELDTGTETLLGTVDDGVAVLTLNRPERRNALSLPMLDGLARTLAAVEVDDEVGCVVLTGAGGAFCAGGDVRAMCEGEGADQPFDEKVHRQRLSHRATSGKIWSMPKPVIAMLPGPAAGAGLALALACDLRYAADTAMITTAFAKVGFSGDYGGTWFLTQIVGTAKARELYYFSDRIPAEEAERLGVVNAVFPAAELEAEVLDRARRLAGRAAGRPPLHEGHAQPRRAERPDRLPRSRGVVPQPHRPHRGPPGSGPGLRGEAAAGVPGAVSRSQPARTCRCPDRSPAGSGQRQFGDELRQRARRRRRSRTR